jgi:hypothetical protein
MVHWSLVPDEDTRLEHSARLELWSASAARMGGRGPEAGAPASVEYVRDVVERAGFVVRRHGRSNIGVLVDERVRGFGPTQAIDAFLGAEGRSLYHLWSGLAHHAGWAIRPRGFLEFADDGGGVRSSTYAYVDLHVELAADIASVVSAAGRAMGHYFGRDSVPFLATCAEIENALRTLVPAIQHTLGRPPQEPTDTRQVSATSEW